MDPGTIGAISAAIGVPLVLSYLQRAGRKVVPHEPRSDRSEPHAGLRERGWLFRDFVLTVDGREWRVKYQAGGAGEHVLVDGKQVAHGAGLASLVPRHDFVLGDHQGLIELDVRWFVLIKGFRLSLDGLVLYGEGSLST
jgi:hypothetical protein